MCEIVYAKHVALGWGCCHCRHYNGLQRDKCRESGHDRCTPLTIPPQMKQGVYCEEGGRWKVEIVTVWFEDCGEWVNCNLRLRGIETLQRGMLGDIAPGTEFTVSTNVKYANNNMCWTLESL